MNAPSDFRASALGYARRYALGRAFQAGARWAVWSLSAALALAVLAKAASPWAAWLVAPVGLLPPIAAATAAFLRGGGAPGALSWLDREYRGGQRLPAAWEFRESPSAFRLLVEDEGRRFLAGLGPTPRAPRPSPGRLLAVIALAGAVLAVLSIGLPEALLGRLSRDLIDQGEALMEFAETWAARTGSDGNREELELAERMGDLGRRMAEGKLGEKQAERSLAKLEEDIARRRDALSRDALAQKLSEDLNVDPETAEEFRSANGPLSEESLAELSQAIASAGDLSGADRDTLEKLLADPSLRDEEGGGTTALTDALAKALADALSAQDPGQRRLSDARDSAHDARNALEGGGAPGDPGNPESRGDAGSGGLPAEDANGDQGRSSSGAGEGGGGNGDIGRQGPGSGRGTGAVEDANDGANDGQPARAPGGDMELNAVGERDQSWKTVIRAWSDQGSPTTDESEITAEWRHDVESVIRREDIPPQVRDYVRDYFLALEEEPGS